MSGIGIDRLGILSYGSVEWRGCAQVTTSYKPIIDPATKVHYQTELTVSVKGVVGCPDEMTYADNDAYLNAIRSVLTKPKLLFIHKSDGCGDIAVTGGDSTDPVVDNGAGGDLKQPDVANGPIPQLLAIRPIGGKNVAYVEWSVKCTVTACRNDLFSGNGVESISSTINYSINDEGLTTRTTSVFIRLINYLRDDIYYRNPDAARSYFSIELPLGFRRQSNTSVSDDRRSLTINYVDTEIDSRNPYPANVVKIDCRHRVRLTRMSLSQLRSSLSGAITLPQGVSLAAGFAVILQIVQQRTKGGFITEFELEEDVWGKNTISFGISFYQLMETVDIDDGDGGTLTVPDMSKAFEITGLFSPAGLKVNDDLTPYNWSDWRDSMDNTNVHNNRGIRQVAFDDVEGSEGMSLVGGCYSDDALQYQAIADAYQGHDPVQPLLWTLENEKPAEQESWMEHYNNTTVHRESRYSDYGYEQGSVPDPVEATDPTTVTQYPGHPSDKDADVFLETGVPKYSVRMSGHAVRVGYKIPRPKLASIGDATANETEGSFSQELAGYFLNQPVYVAAWLMTYRLDKSPGQVNPLSNRPPTPSE